MEIFLFLPLSAQQHPDCEESNLAVEEVGLAPLYTMG